MSMPERPVEPLRREQADAVEWARTVEPARPLTLGEIEAEVLRRRIPPQRRLSVGNRIGQVIGVVVGVPLLLAWLCSPLVGSGIVLAHAADLDARVTRELLPLGRLAFVVASSVPILILGLWWVGRGRCRRWWGLPAAALVALLALATGIAVAVTGAADLEVGFVLWIGATVVTSVGAVVVILVDARGPEPRRVRHDPVAQRFVRVRAEVLGILMDRGLVDVVDRDASGSLLDLPRGGWIERGRRSGRA